MTPNEMIYYGYARPHNVRALLMRDATTLPGDAPIGAAALFDTPTEALDWALNHVATHGRFTLGDIVPVCVKIHEETTRSGAREAAIGEEPEGYALFHLSARRYARYLAGKVDWVEPEQATLFRGMSSALYALQASAVLTGTAMANVEVRPAVRGALEGRTRVTIIGPDGRSVEWSSPSRSL